MIHAGAASHGNAFGISLAIISVPLDENKLALAVAGAPVRNYIARPRTLSHFNASAKTFNWIYNDI
jgi:hypothetical protein